MGIPYNTYGLSTADTIIKHTHTQKMDQLQEHVTFWPLWPYGCQRKAEHDTIHSASLWLHLSSWLLINKSDHCHNCPWRGSLTICICTRPALRNYWWGRPNSVNLLNCECWPNVVSSSFASFSNFQKYVFRHLLGLKLQNII